MESNIIEFLRKEVVNGLFQTTTMQTVWNVWQNKIREILPQNCNEQDFLNLGDYLSDIFKSTGGEGRAQGELSGGGNAWESLIVWYINICCVNTRVVAFKKMGQVPLPIKEAITVNYENFSCSTESDITVVIFPDEDCFTSKEDAHIFFNSRGKYMKKELDKEVGEYFDKFSIGIIQCKTNWNDNAQIPMLWDMIYSAGGFRGRQISVGVNNYSIQSLDSFTYSFVTVPSNKLSNFKPNSVSVKRVKGLSGGNYWGRITEQGIARSVKEIFNNYNSGFDNKNIRTTLKNAVSHIEEYTYFRFSTV